MLVAVVVVEIKHLIKDLVVLVVGVLVDQELLMLQVLPELQILEAEAAVAPHRVPVMELVQQVVLVSSLFVIK